MEFQRIPENRFNNLPGYNFPPHYVELDDGEGGRLRMHYLDAGLGTISSPISFAVDGTQYVSLLVGYGASASMGLDAMYHYVRSGALSVMSGETAEACENCPVGG